MKFIVNIALILLIAVLLGYRAAAQDSGEFWNSNVEYINKHKGQFYAPWQGEEKTKMERLWTEIGQELENERPNRGGTYAELGYESGYLLRWSLKRGFVFIPYKESLISRFSYGQVEITADSELVLHSQKGYELTIGRGEKPWTWIPVRGGEYLVPKEEIAAFGEFNGGFGEYNGFPRKRMCDGCGTFALRVDKNNTNSTPLAPPKYLKYIKNPIEAEIIYIGKNRKGWTIANTLHITGDKVLSSVTPVLINAGSRKGVKTGLMFLLVDSGDNSYQVLKITRVRLNTSEGIVVRNIDANGREVYPGDIYNKVLQAFINEPFPPLKKGTKVSTSALAY